jgi:citrate synthase
VASTYATCYSGISAAIGALSGFRHGGASEQMMDVIDAIGSIENIDPWLDRALAEGRQIAGMGHPVYQVKDPRAVVMEKLLQDLCQLRGDSTLYDFLTRLEAGLLDRMSAENTQTYPNVHFYAGAIYTLLGIPKDLFTPIFAAARCAGWLAHILEQRRNNQLYRPTDVYVGEGPKTYTPVSERTS